jgi:hypothetical protein
MAGWDGREGVNSPRLPRRREARGSEPSIPHPLAKLLEEMDDDVDRLRGVVVPALDCLALVGYIRDPIVLRPA